MRFTLPFCLALVLAPSALGQQQHIAPTDPLSPADEQKALKVPDGFEVQLDCHGIETFGVCTPFEPEAFTRSMMGASS